MPCTKTITLVDLHPRSSDFRDDVLEGLRADPKALAPKYFYDKRGSELFERITELDEYYPTRTEIGILEKQAEHIADLLGENCLLIEYGSGASLKIRILLDALEGGHRYVAIDISREHLIESVERLADEYPRLDAYAVCADYTQPFELPAEALQDAGRRAIFFPGSTIGNFSPSEAARFLRLTADEVGPGGSLLIGVDLKKDRHILEAAYDDEQGVTAEFNLNLLRRTNRELGADFDLAEFRHRAIYNEVEGRVEMHLESLRDQQVRIGEERFRFRQGETIHTENSYKFSVREFQDLASRCGFEPLEVWTDDQGLFSLHYMRSSV